MTQLKIWQISISWCTAAEESIKDTTWKQFSGHIEYKENLQLTLFKMLDAWSSFFFSVKQRKQLFIKETICLIEKPNSILQGTSG